MFQNFFFFLILVFREETMSFLNFYLGLVPLLQLKVFTSWKQSRLNQRNKEWLSFHFLFISGNSILPLFCWHFMRWSWVEESHFVVLRGLSVSVSFLRSSSIRGLLAMCVFINLIELIPFHEVKPWILSFFAFGWNLIHLIRSPGWQQMGMTD